MAMGDGDGDEDEDEVLLRLDGVVSALCWESWDAQDETWAVHQLRAYCLSARMNVGQQGFSLSRCFSLSRLHSRWTYEILTNGFIWPARHWTVDEQSTPPGIQGERGQGAGGGAAPPWTLWKYLLSKLRFTCACACVCVRCVHILFMFTYRNQFELKPFEQDMKNPFMLFFPAAKSIFKLFSSPTWCLCTFICHNMVRSYVIPLPHPPALRCLPSLKKYWNETQFESVVFAQHRQKRNTRPIDIDAICDKWPHMNNKSCDWCAVSRNTLTAF